jgi:NADH-quinone oxidoreductase subunit M
MLWLYQRVFFGKASEDLSHHMFDLVPREHLAMIPLIVLMVWMGSFSQSFIPPISVTNAGILGPIDARKEVQVENRNGTEPAIIASLKELLHAR